MSQKNELEKIFNQYLIKLRKTSMDGKTEMTDRSFLSDLLENLQDKLHIIHEPPRDKFGSPDFRIKKLESTIGYVETKKIGSNIEELVKSEQILRYCEHVPNILLTNYVDFIVVRDSKIVDRSSLGSYKEIIDGKKNCSESNASDTAKLIRNFLSVAPVGIKKVDRLAKALAPRAQLLRDFFLTQDDEDKEIYTLYTNFRDRVFKNFEFKEFVDVFAQIVVYGLFLARLNDKDLSTPVTIDNARKHIPHNFDLIKQLVRFLDGLEEENYHEISWVVDEILEIINSFDVPAIHEDLAFSHKIAKEKKGEIIEKDPYVYFYEYFLKEYDPDLKKKLGVYYTPLPVVKFIIRGVEDILRREFGIKEGFSSQKVTALDFATGTGTFLVEMFRTVLDELPKDSGLLPHIVREHLLKNFYGFEYMMAPYAIAHLKVSEFLKEYGYEMSSDERLGIYLTNTLESLDNGGQQRIMNLESLNRESEASQEIKEKPILVIVGNPPYSAHSRNNGAFITDLISDYKFVDGKPLGERNSKILQDDYVKFIRFAEWKMNHMPEGIVGVICNHGFLDNVTCRGMRESLLKTFNRIYVVNLHGNVKKKEICPDGSKDENIFNIQQGSCIVFLVKKPEVKKGVFYSDSWGLRENKFKRLNLEHINDVEWQELKPETPNYYLLLFDRELMECYNKFWSVKEIFVEGISGIQTSRDSLVVDFTIEALKEKISIFKDLSIPDTQMRNRFGLKNTGGWKIKDAREYMANLDNWEKHIKTASYRPFDKRPIYYHVKMIDGPRENVMRHMIDGGNVGLVTSRQFGVVGSNKFDTTFIINKTVDFNFFRRGGAILFPLYLYTHINPQTSFTKENERIENFDPKFRNYINDLYSHHYSPEEIFGYIYGVLHSPYFREKYLQYLKIDFPRVPFVKSRQLFDEMSKLGWDLCQVHLMKDVPNLKLGDYFGANGSNVVEKIQYDDKDERLYINSQQYFAPIPQNVWEFHIGGYQVLDKYLKSRKGRMLSFDEIKNVTEVANILQFTINQMQEIDSIYKKIDLEN